MFDMTLPPFTCH